MFIVGRLRHHTNSMLVDRFGKMLHMCIVGFASLALSLLLLVTGMQPVRRRRRSPQTRKTQNIEFVTTSLAIHY
jgi:hypothetical protein